MYTYNVNIDTDITMNMNLVREKISSVLNDKRGWKRLGYEFYYQEHNPNIRINIVNENKIVNICKFRGLSCADTSNNIVYINIKRWRRGSTASKLSLDDYRTYLVNHEIGHLPGRSHRECGKRGTKVPVMVQQTLGIANCKPNPWPLYWE
jgi:hypothetical protein